MAPFTKGDIDNRDWFLLQDGSITKYYHEHLLRETVTWLRDHGYTITEHDCAQLKTTPALLKAIGDGLGFPDYFQGNNLDGFDDFLYDLNIPNKGGIVLVLRRYDLMVRSGRRQA